LLRLAYLGMTFANQRGQLLAAKASRSADEFHTVKDNYATMHGGRCRTNLNDWSQSLLAGALKQTGTKQSLCSASGVGPNDRSMGYCGHRASQNLQASRQFLAHLQILV
jgi:3-mercaptopyruvate sulfurtransferase SseA